MGDAARQGLTVEAFYTWVTTQEAKHELVDGDPVVMAGANRRHDRVVTNTLRMIGNQLRGQRCQPFSADTYIAIPAGNRRLPDLGVDCGIMDDDSLEAIEPRLVVEISSPLTRTFDRTEKLEEYKTVSGLDYILDVDADSPQLRLYWREESGAWASERIAGLEAEVRMPTLGLTLALADIYEGLAFKPRMTLVASGEPAAPFNI